MLDTEESELLVVKRREIQFNDFERFRIGAKNFGKQFCDIYNARLTALRDTVVARAKEKWGDHPILQIDRLSEFDDDQGLIVLVGTLYKHQELKPSILKEISDELQVTHQPLSSNYSSDKDKLFLEDETLRTKLLGNLPNPRKLVTGIVCAVLGYGTNDGSFWVKDFCFPGCCRRTSVSFSTPPCTGKLLLVSGFDFAKSADSMSLNLLSEWISGLAGIPNAQREEASILQIVIAGNSVRGCVETFTHKDYEGKRRQASAGELESILATHRFDSYLSTIVENCSVIVMPGQFDPSGHSLPQQSLHPCMLAKSCRYKSLRNVTNPWVGRIGDRIVAGSSGQPIDDITKVGGLEEATPLDWLERTLIWRHFAPTAPDTLPAYPYFGTDPFVMRECPDIYFVGNMEKYDTKLYLGEEGQTVRLICIPKFSKTETAVIVDLDTLDCTAISFGSS